MSIFYSIIGVIAIGLTAWIAVVLIKFNKKRIYIIRCFEKASSHQLDEIYELVEQCGEEKPNGCILARTNKRADDSVGFIRIPKLNDFPWSGRLITINTHDDVQFSFTTGDIEHIQLNGDIYCAVKVPRKKTTSGNYRNDYMPGKYIAKNAALKEKLRNLCDAHPEDLLAYLLASGADSFEFDSINQARIGTSASWLQNPEYQYCDDCRRRMDLVVQLPGTLVSTKGYNEGTFFWFGCKKHPENLKLISQLT